MLTIPFVQGTGAVDKNIASVLESRAVLTLQLY